jgi:dihydrofolate reductase
MTLSLKPTITLVVAMASNRVIGKDNKMPWHLPEDLQHFKATTLGHTMIMGRKTFDSIGRPLPGRKTIVVSRNPEWQFAGVQTANSLEQAISFAQKQIEPDNQSSLIFVVGGSQIYQQALALDLADVVIATEIDKEIEGDAFFPPLDPIHWEVKSAKQCASKSGLNFCIKHYGRRTTP